MGIYLRVTNAKTMETDPHMSRAIGVRTWIVASFLGWVLGGGWATAAAQEGAYAFQIRGGETLPVGTFRDDATGWEERAGRGPSLGMGFNFPLYRFVGGYLGFSQHRFACDQDICPRGNAWVSTGYDVALRVALGRRGIRPWIQGGIHTSRIEGRTLQGGDVENLRSEGGWGHEVAGGILVKVGERMSLSPGVRYGSVDVPFSAHPTMGLRYLVLDLGLVVGF